MKKYITLIIVLLQTTFVASAQQTPYQTTQKYWWYRYRLVNDFMKVGDNCGESIPASERFKHYLNQCSFSFASRSTSLWMIPFRAFSLPSLFR